MRIAVVTEAFHPAVDEDTDVVRHLLDQYAAAGHRLLLVTQAPGLSSYRDVRVVRVRLDDLSASFTAAAHIGDELDAFAPDVVEVHSPGRLGSRALAEAAALGLPTLVVQSAPVAHPARWRRATSSADRVLATSAWLARRLEAVDGVWRPGVDVTDFGPQRRSPALRARWARHGLVTVGYAGDLSARGRRRLADLRVPDTRLVALGEPGDRATMGRRLPEVRLLTPRGSEERAAVLASLDLFVTTRPDARLREAMASGVPVVTVAGVGTGEVVEHGVSGLVVPDRPGALAAAVRTLAHDPARRTALGRQARTVAEDRDWSRAALELSGWTEAAGRAERGPVPAR